MDQIERARKIVSIVSVQNRYSFADREWDYVVDYCERHGIAFIPWFPLASGRVANMLLEGIANNHQKTPKQVALAWLLKRSPIMLPIPGTSSIEHLEENVQAASLRLTDEEYRELTRLRLLSETSCLIAAVCWLASLIESSANPRRRCRTGTPQHPRPRSGRHGEPSWFDFPARDFPKWVNGFAAR